MDLYGMLSMQFKYDLVNCFKAGKYYLAQNNVIQALWTTEKGG